MKPVSLVDSRVKNLFKYTPSSTLSSLLKHTKPQYCFDTGHSAKSARGRLHLNTHTPLTQRSRSGLTMLLSKNSVRTYQERAQTQLVREHWVTVVSSTLCADSYSMSVPPRVTAVARKRHRSFCQRSRSGLTMPLSKHSVGTYPETSSHATRQGTLGYSRLSSLSHCGLILA